MIGTVSEEVDVNVPACEAWNFYCGLEFSKVVGSSFPEWLNSIDLVEGDGGLGTILHVRYVPGLIPGLKPYWEKFTLVDHERRVKDAEAIKGGFLDLGFTSFKFRAEVTEKEGSKNKCITKLAIHYEVKDEVIDANPSLISILEVFVKRIVPFVADYLVQNYKNENN